MSNIQHTKYFIITEYSSGCLPEPDSTRIAFSRSELRTLLSESRDYFESSDHSYHVITPVNELLKLKPNQAAIYVQGDNLWTVSVECVSAIERDSYTSQGAEAFGNDFTFVDDTQDLQALFQSNAAPYIRGLVGDMWNVTAAFVRIMDGELESVWITESTIPHLLTTSFACVYNVSNKPLTSSIATPARYVLLENDRVEVVSSDDIMSFIHTLDEHVAGFGDADWDEFWGGSTYVHLWDERGFFEASPSDLIVGAYLAADYTNHPLFDALYRKWLTPSPLGVKLDNEDESVLEVYQFVLDELSATEGRESSVANLDANPRDDKRFVRSVSKEFATDDIHTHTCVDDNPPCALLVYDSSGCFIEISTLEDETIATNIADSLSCMACVVQPTKNMLYRNAVWLSLYPDALSIEQCLGHIIRAEQASHQKSVDQFATAFHDSSNPNLELMDQEEKLHLLDQDNALTAMLFEFMQNISKAYEFGDRIQDGINEHNLDSVQSTALSNLISNALAAWSILLLLYRFTSKLSNLFNWAIRKGRTSYATVK